MSSLAPDYLHAVIAAAQAHAPNVSAQGARMLALAAAALLASDLHIAGKCPRSEALRELEHKPLTELRSEVIRSVAGLALNDREARRRRELAVDWLVAAGQLGAWGRVQQLGRHGR